jgi:hypothetical protein
MNENNGLCLVHIRHDMNLISRDWNCGIFSLHVQLLDWSESNESSWNFYFSFFFIYALKRRNNWSYVFARLRFQYVACLTNTSTSKPSLIYIEYDHIVRTPRNIAKNTHRRPHVCLPLHSHEITRSPSTDSRGSMYWGMLLESVDVIKFRLKSDKSNGPFARNT